MKSVLGVPFGATIDEVQRQFPVGVRETSPYGATSFRVDDAVFDGVSYRSVVYEFTDQNGMVLAIGYFDPDQDAEVSQQLMQDLGPSTNVSVPEPGNSGSAVTSWSIRDGEVFLNLLKHRVVLLSRGGVLLAPDIRLRG